MSFRMVGRRGGSRWERRMSNAGWNAKKGSRMRKERWGWFRSSKKNSLDPPKRNTRAPPLSTESSGVSVDAADILARHVHQVRSLDPAYGARAPYDRAVRRSVRACRRDLLRPLVLRLRHARRAGIPHLHERAVGGGRSEEHTAELQSLAYLVCRLLLEKKKRIPSSSRVSDTPVDP